MKTPQQIFKEFQLTMRSHLIAENEHLHIQSANEHDVEVKTNEITYATTVLKNICGVK